MYIDSLKFFFFSSWSVSKYFLLVHFISYYLASHFVSWRGRFKYMPFGYVSSQSFVSFCLKCASLNSLNLNFGGHSLKIFVF